MSQTKEQLELQVLASALAIARGEIGVRENIVNGSGTNRGKRVDEYQRADSLPGEGYAWCASFTAWVIRQVEAALKIDVPWTFSASCDFVWADGRKRGLMRTTPQAGDIFLVRAKVGNGYSTHDAIHTGLVSEVLKSKFKTVEGNTNADGGREGIGVMSHERPISSRYAFLRFVDGVNLGQKALMPQPSQQSAWTTYLYQGKTSKKITVNAYDSRPCMASRDFADFFKLPLVWNAQEQQVTIGGHDVEAQLRLINGRSIYPVRVLAETLGFSVVPDVAKRVVEVRAA